MLNSTTIREGKANDRYARLLQAEPDQAYRRMSCVYEMGKLFSNFVSVDITLPAILKIANQIFPMQSAVLVESRKDRRRMTVWHAPDAGDAQIKRVKDCALSLVVENPQGDRGDVFRVSESASQSRIEDFKSAASPSDDKKEHFVYVPLRSKAQVPFGAFQLEGFERPTELDLAFIEVFTEHSCLALERYFSWLDELRLREFAEEEKSRQLFRERELRAAAELAGQRLAESEARFRAAFANAATGIALTTDGGKILQVNGAYSQITGFSEEELRSRDFSTMIHPEDWPTSVERMQDLLTRKVNSFVIEERHLNKNGSYVWIQNSVSAVWEDDGKVTELIFVCEDISLRKMAEEQLQKKAAELSASNSELLRFAFVASHDLKEPLRVISSYAQMLKRVGTKLEPKSDRCVDYIVDGVSRMYELIDDLLSYSRLGHCPSEFRAVNSTEIAEHALSNLQTSISESSARVKVEPLPTLFADRAELLQLFQNLIANAIKYRGDKEPDIRISAKRENESWVFAVKDNGIGIEQTYFDKIFVLFQRLHRRQDYSGTGIGLSICKKIVERHGGRIWLDSRVNYGSTFYFSFPDRFLSVGARP